MAEYEINGKKINFDNSKKYLDFYWENKQPIISEINLEGMLEAIQTGKIPLDGEFRKYLTSLKRWEKEAPRKRTLRNLRRNGIHVYTTDILFEEDGGEVIIQNLENTGKFAAYLLREVYRQNW